jgi:hypothetical protein
MQTAATSLESFLATKSPMHAAKANAALIKHTRVNGREIMQRHQLIETHMAQGYRTRLRPNGERVFLSPDGSWFDAQAITTTALDYASFLETLGAESLPPANR